MYTLSPPYTISCGVHYSGLFHYWTQNYNFSRRTKGEDNISLSPFIMLYIYLYSTLIIIGIPSQSQVDSNTIPIQSQVLSSRHFRAKSLKDSHLGRPLSPSPISNRPVLAPNLGCVYYYIIKKKKKIKTKHSRNVSQTGVKIGHIDVGEGGRGRRKSFKRNDLSHFNRLGDDLGTTWKRIGDVLEMSW